jgi:50S ribosomal protein L16 3-hydroxylase
MARAVEALNALRMNDPARLADWFGRFITSYRSAGILAAPAGGLDRGSIESGLGAGGLLHRNPFSRVAWRRLDRGALLFVAGQSWRLPVADAKRLAGASSIDAGGYARLGEAGRAVLAELAAAGHYQPAGDEEE